MRWLIALVVFLLALGITWTDVYGVQTGGPDVTGVQSLDATYDDPGSTNRPGDYQQPTDSNDPPPTAIPEPTTLILLAGGMGAMYAVRRWRKSR